MTTQRLPIVGISLFVVLGSAICYALWVVVFRHSYDWQPLTPYWGNFLSGWLCTLWISIAALVLSIAIGVVLTMGQLSSFPPTAVLSRIYVEFMRGTPLLVVILIGYYLVADEMGWESRYSFGIVALAMFTGAYLSEIFRAGVQSIPKSQWLSARAIGLTQFQTYRHIVFPQTIRRVLPASTGQFANLIKDSSLLYLISVPEFFMQARQIGAKTYAIHESYLPLLAYLILTIPLTFLSRALEKKYVFEQ